jgi:hypothetical protein
MIGLIGLFDTARDSLTHSWSWALFEKLPIVQPLKNFPAFYGTRRFITAFTRALHRSLSWTKSIQSIPSHHTSLRSILILSTHLRLGLHSVTTFYNSLLRTNTRHDFTGRCSVAASNSGSSPSSGLINCPRPHLPASHSDWTTAVL